MSERFLLGSDSGHVKTGEGCDTEASSSRVLTVQVSVCHLCDESFV